MEENEFSTTWEEKFAEIICDGGHTVFFERFLLATDIKSLVIISPWISTLPNENIRLEDIIFTIKKHKIHTTVIMRDPKRERLNIEATKLFRQCRHNIDLYFNNELHAKVYVCKCTPFGFALIGSANLSGRATRAHEIGVFIEGKGYGKEIVEELDLLGKVDLLNRAGTYRDPESKRIGFL